jgi:sterol desaturase/sphingolipid hydroxylase (fatty acid hydroxylase superfamily)
MMLTGYIVPILAVAAVFIPLERLFPLRPQQGLLRKHWKLDTIYFLINRIWIQIGIIAVVISIGYAAQMLMPQTVRNWVSSQPFWLQLPMALILCDIGFYFAHRCFHKIPALWKYHAIHHSIESLDWLAAHRIHPIDQICTKGVSFIPLIALNFSDQTVAAFSLIFMWQAVLIHSNTRLNIGPLSWIIASPRFHHWHHADQQEAIDRNFAAQFSFLDAIFGTIHMPKEMPEKYGTKTKVPEDYLGQMAFPLRTGESQYERHTVD